MAPSFSSERRWVFPSSLLIQHLLLASIRAPGASLVVIASPSGRMVPGVRTKAGSSFHLLCLPWCLVKGVSLFAGSKKDPHRPSCTITKWRFCHQKVQQFFIQQPVTEPLLCCFTLNFFFFENFQTDRTFAVTVQSTFVSLSPVSTDCSQFGMPALSMQLFCRHTHIHTYTHTRSAHRHTYTYTHVRTCTHTLLPDHVKGGCRCGCRCGGGPPTSKHFSLTPLGSAF